MLNKERMLAYLEYAIGTFDGDPPDSDFQIGYLEALKEVAQWVREDGWEKSTHLHTRT